MIFVVELLMQNHLDKVRQWERDREEWVKGGTYRMRKDYPSLVPHPSKGYALAIKIIGIALAYTVLACLFWWVSSSATESDRKAQIEENRVLPGKDCKAFNVGDHVTIKKGDYTDTTATIMGGCAKDQDYEVKIDKGQKADLPNDGEAPVDVGDKMTSISSKKDLVIIKKEN